MTPPVYKKGRKSDRIDTSMNLTIILRDIRKVSWGAALILPLFFILQGLSPAAGAEQGMLLERIGNSIPPDIHFLDESGRETELGSLMGKPLVVSLVYHGCESICPKLLGDVAGAATGMDLKPGADYRLVTISFDEKDTPEIAASRKRNFVAAAGSAFPDDGWRFLTGTQDNIRKLTDAVGFSFKRAGEGFVHPRAIIVVSPDGKVVRYLHAARLRPEILKMAIREASGGNWLMSYCFSYDAAEGRYVYNTGRVLLTLMVAAFAFAVSWTWYVRSSAEGCRAA